MASPYTPADGTDAGDAAADETQEKQQYKQSRINEAKAMAQMDGKDQKGDIRFSGSLPEAMLRFKEMIEERREADKLASTVAYFAAAQISDEAEGTGKKKCKAKKKKKQKSQKGELVQDPARWDFRSVHLGHCIAAGKTADDVIDKFLKWSQKPEDQLTQSYNLSKAMRRLESFATFQEGNYDAFFDTPIDPSGSEYQSYAKFGFETVTPKWTVPDGAAAGPGCTLCLMDLSTCDAGAISEAHKSGEVTDRIVLRAMWKMMLECLFDDRIATHGMIFVQDFTGMSFGMMMKFNRVMKGVEPKMNEMFYGCMPLKMKECILVGSPWWLNMLIGFMRVFISKKMSRRIVNTDRKKLHERVGGADQLPKGTIGGTRPFEPRYGSHPRA